MKLSRIVAVVFFSLVFALNASAQRNWSAEADEAFELQQFALAIDRYKVAITKIKKNKPEKARLTYRIAECYRYMNDPKQQEIWYKKAIGQKHDDPLAVLYYANALKVNEKYPEAIIQYNVYKTSVPSDPRGENGAKSCELAQKWKDNPTRYVVENMKQFNSKEMDFSPTYADKKYKSLIFTSAREGAMGGDLDEGTGQQFTDLFLVTQDKKGKWSTPVILPEPISSKFNEGAASMNDKGSGLFFTRCGVEKKKKMGCQIYFAQKKGPNWDFPELITLNNDTSSSALTFGHPSISSNELTLYFASDMPGGQGGKDVWCVKRTKKNKPWGKPENLGPVINTAGDEMFPYIHDNGMLFFSSNYHLGMGGMDIFKSEPKADGSFGAPENMKFPMNSPGDDFGITFKGASIEEGYFTSNRKGGKGSDDIWYFSTPPIFFTLKGVVTDDSTKQIITGAIIKCVGSDGTIIYDTTDVTGGYFFSNKQILPNTSYDLLASKEGYYSAKGKESTVGFEQSRDLVHDFQLKPIPKIPIVLPDILYKIGDWTLQTQYQDSLNGLYQTLIDNPNIVIELGSHTDSRPIPMTNDTLSLRRAQSVVDYLISKGIEGE
ncbi:MAG: OmpA family protein, partial [Bacteroidota bacterium]